MKHKIPELKNLQEEFNSTIDQVEQKISKLENRAVESNQRRKIENNNKKNPPEKQWR